MAQRSPRLPSAITRSPSLWAGVEAGAKTVVLRAEREPRGSIRARVLYLTDEQAQEYDANREPSGMLASLPLIEGIKFMQWNFWDERTEEWVDAWDRQQYGNRRPSLVNLYLQFYDGSAADNITFWIPAMANPETFTRGQAGGSGRGGPNDDGSGGPGAGPDGRGGPGGRDGGRGGRGGPWWSWRPWGSRRSRRWGRAHPSRRRPARSISGVHTRSRPAALNPCAGLCTGGFSPL